MTFVYIAQSVKVLTSVHRCTPASAWTVTTLNTLGDSDVISSFLSMPAVLAAML